MLIHHVILKDKCQVLREMVSLDGYLEMLQSTDVARSTAILKERFSTITAREGRLNAALASQYWNVVDHRQRMSMAWSDLLFKSENGESSETQNIRFICGNDLWTAKAKMDFNDGHHMSIEGANRFSQWLAETIQTGS